MLLRTFLVVLFCNLAVQPLHAETWNPEDIFECKPDRPSDYHLWFCDLVQEQPIHGAPKVLKAYSAEHARSFLPTQRILLYNTDRGWFLQAHFYKLQDGYRDGRSYQVIDSRTLFTSIEPMAALATLETVNENDLHKPEAGPITQECLDGSNLIIRTLTEQGRHIAVRHVCDGRDDLDRFAEVLLKLALKTDPKLKPYTTGFTIQETAE